MDKMSSVKRSSLTAVCIALAFVLPTVFHAIGLGSAFSPMHIPVLLCGIVCGPWYGLFCGIISPVLSSVLTGMPTTLGLVPMIPELAIYGLVTGVVFKHIHTKNLMADIYLALVSAMLLGRVSGGIASALFYLGDSESFTITLWATTYFVKAIPGIAAQLIIIPALIVALEQSHIMPKRYKKKKETEINNGTE